MQPRSCPAHRWLVLLCAILLLGSLTTVALAQSNSLTVAQLVVCEKVENRSPVNVTDIFPAGTEMVYCFLEAREITEDTEVKIVWYHEDQELARVPLAIGQGSRWRTYSSKKTGGQSGNWKVYLLDSADNTLATVQFVLE